VVAVDTNVLVYAHRREMPTHDAALGLLRDLAGGGSVWAIAWPSIYEFFSVVTNPKIWKHAASTPSEAWAQITALMAAPGLRMLSEPDGFAAVLASFAKRARVRGPIIHDARIAAICVAHGVEKLLTRDRDFSPFPELVTEDPFLP
jgi:toxin-antitoxin system PIN domain toxin